MQYSCRCTLHGDCVAGLASKEVALKTARQSSKLAPGGGPPKPLCRNYGQLPKFTGNWVDHVDPEYRHSLFSLLLSNRQTASLPLLSSQCS